MSLENDSTEWLQTRHGLMVVGSGAMQEKYPGECQAIAGELQRRGFIWDYDHNTWYPLDNLPPWMEWAKNLPRT
jgi:hypothetical protein